jgi:hypothetical protein
MGRNVFEVTDSVLALPSSKGSCNLKRTLEKRCGFTEDQMNKCFSGVAKSQLEDMARIIAESNQPLRYSRTEKELLHEISLATGKEAESLDEITAARFDADAARVKYNRDWFSLKGDFRLLRVPAPDGGFLSVSINPDRNRGGDAREYTLKSVSGSYPGPSTLDDALKSFANTVKYCSGGDAVQDIQYFDPK